MKDLAKRILPAILAWLCLALTAGAQLGPTNPATWLTLAWDPVPNVVGYRVYYGVSSRNYTNLVAVGNATQVTITNFVRGVTYYFAATAVDAAGLESDFSGEVSFRFNPLPQAPVLRLSMGLFPLDVRINGRGEPGRGYEIDASSDLAAWLAVGTVTADSEGSFTFVDLAASSFQRRFYRARSST